MGVLDKMIRRKIFEILFWILLAVTIILILWRIFGESPSDFSIIISIGLMLLLKMWAMSDETKEFKHEVRMSFARVKQDFDELKKELAGRRRK